MPIRGVLAAESLQPGSSLLMLKALQRAHYRAGLRIVEMPTLVQVAESIGLDAALFTVAFEGIGDDVLFKHLESTHALMYEVGARGYPTFVAQVGNRFERLPHERFYGKPEGFLRLVSAVLVQA